MTPTKLGRYEIEGELGKGAMGVVYLARDPIIGRKLALKTFRLGFSAGDEELAQFRQRFLREAQSAGILNHPNIVTIHDVVEDAASGSFFIAMEYVEGTDLKRILQTSDRLDLDFVLDTIGQVAEGLDYAHSKGVVHRDIKPANVIITNTRQAKITDFGIARVDASNLTVEGQLLGTPNYMAPEQITGREVDHRTDLFSLGVMLYELLTRHKPFAGDNLTMVSHRIVYDHFTPAEEHVPGLPAPILAILERALAKRAEDRYSCGAEMARDLRRVAKSLHGPQPSTTELPRPATTAATDLSTGGDAHRVATVPPPVLPPLPSLPAGSASTPPAAAGGPRGGPARLRRDGVSRGDDSRVDQSRGDRSSGSWSSALARRPPPRRAVAVAVATVVLASLAFWLPTQFVPEAPPVVANPELDRRLEVLAAIREGQRHLQAADPGQALDVFERALLRHPDHPELLRLRSEANRAVLAVEGRASEEAYIEERLEKAARALEEQRWTETIALTEEILELAPEHARAMVLKRQAENGRSRRLAMLERVEEPAQAPEGAQAIVEAPVGSPEGVGGAATLRIDFFSQSPEGTLTVYGGDEQVLQQTFHFTEKAPGLFRRSRDVPGGFIREVELDPGALKLKVYVYLKGSDNVLREIAGNFLPGRRRTLQIRVDGGGGIAVDLD